MPAGKWSATSSVINRKHDRHRRQEGLWPGVQFEAAGFFADAIRPDSADSSGASGGDTP